MDKKEGIINFQSLQHYLEQNFPFLLNFQTHELGLSFQSATEQQSSSFQSFQSSTWTRKLKIDFLEMNIGRYPVFRFEILKWMEDIDWSEREETNLEDLEEIIEALLTGLVGQPEHAIWRKIVSMLLEKERKKLLKIQNDSSERDLQNHEKKEQSETHLLEKKSEMKDEFVILKTVRNNFFLDLLKSFNLKYGT